MIRFPLQGAHSPRMGSAESGDQARMVFVCSGTDDKEWAGAQGGGAPVRVPEVRVLLHFSVQALAAVGIERATRGRQPCDICGKRRVELTIAPHPASVGPDIPEVEHNGAGNRRIRGRAHQGQPPSHAVTDQHDPARIDPEGHHAGI